MRCGCGEGLARISRKGEPMLRSAGLLLKAEGLAAICPRCKADVPVGGDMLKALQTVLLVSRPVSR